MIIKSNLENHQKLSMFLSKENFLGFWFISQKKLVTKVLTFLCAANVGTTKEFGSKIYKMQVGQIQQNWLIRSEN